MFSTAMQAQILCHMHGFSALGFYCNDCLFAAHIWTSFNLAWFLTSGYPTNKHQCRLFKGWIRSFCRQRFSGPTQLLSTSGGCARQSVRGVSPFFQFVHEHAATGQLQPCACVIELHAECICTTAAIAPCPFPGSCATQFILHLFMHPVPILFHHRIVLVMSHYRSAHVVTD